MLLQNKRYKNNYITISQQQKNYRKTLPQNNSNTNKKHNNFIITQEQQKNT